MAQLPSIIGTKQVLANIKARQAVMGTAMNKALRLAGLKLQRESQQKVPVNFGNLKASAYTRVEGTGMKTVVTVGFTAFYAVYVHEAVGMVLKGQPRPQGRGLYWDPQGKAQAKFLEEPARTMAPELLQIIRNITRILPP
jgi:hypothetical protein